MAKRKKQSSTSMFGFELKNWVEGSRILKGKEKVAAGAGEIYYFDKRDAKSLKTLLKPHLREWQLGPALKAESEVQHFSGRQGPLWLLFPPAESARGSGAGHYGLLAKGPYVRARDQFGSLVNQIASFGLKKLVLDFRGASLDEIRGALVGLEIASYAFLETRGKAPRTLPQLLLRTGNVAVTPALLKECASLGVAVNLARHLVNLPAGELHPQSYAHALEELFAGSECMKVEVWQKERLLQEKMNLLLAVGGGARNAPCLVHLRYRPAKSSGKAPLAFVGKGITFDTGGLDLKPSASMRWMKKDMGGSASVVGLCYFLEKSGWDQPCDFYLALAENAVDQDSMRPGDVFVSRSGLSVEIANTDAEGRLVLGDALDVAVKQEGADEPRAVINLATLTGAIKVGLGAEIAGLFGNNDRLADLILNAGNQTGELCWRMPLYQPYRAMFKSSFADMANSSEGGFGGAITAALFLQSFVGLKPWAHLDIYAWKDSPGGAYLEPGGNGQAVQGMAELLRKVSENPALLDGLD